MKKKKKIHPVMEVRSQRSLLPLRNDVHLLYVF